MSPFGIDRTAIIDAGLRVLPVLDRTIARYSRIGEHQMFPSGFFPWTKDLESHWQAIRGEAENALRDRRAIPPLRSLSPDHEKIAVDDRWRAFILWGYGLRWQANCERCPETARQLEAIPDLLTAFFSVLLARSHIPRHTGPTKMILTGHLGLMVPRDRPACHMQIGDHDVAWEEGRAFIFDDMYPHEVWNDTDEDRVILLLHVKRPLRFPGSVLRDGFFAALRRSPLVRDGLRNLERWERAASKRAA